MKPGGVRFTIYYTAVVALIPYSILTPSVWPPSLAGDLPLFVGIACGLVSSFALLRHHSKTILKIVPSLFAGLYSFAVLAQVFPVLMG